MLTICNLELSRTYINGDYRKHKFQTVAGVKISGGYSDTKITLTDERTDKIVAFILEQIRESLTVEMEKLEPEPVEDTPQVQTHPALEVAGPL